MAAASPKSRPESASVIAALLAVLILAVLAYSGFVIQSQERRWHEFNQYVRARDARWERYIERTDASLNAIHDRLGRIGVQK